jgi:hypothetical protein
MKKFLLVISLAITSISSSQTRLGTSVFNKKEVPAVMGEMPYEQEVVKDGIDKNFEKLGYKSKKSKGFLMYTAVLMPKLGAQPYDIYVTVDRKSRQEKSTSIVTFLISKGLENFASDVNDDSLMNNTRAYLSSLTEIVAAYDLKLQIEAQDEVAKKAEKKYTNLQEDAVALQKKKKKIEEEIIQNTLDQASQKNEKERQIQILEVLKSKQKS